jgi:hypothetical protein
MANLLAKNGKIIGGVPQYNEWEYLGQTVGSAEIEIPAEAEEVCCISGFSTTWMDFHFLTTMDDINVARKGFYLSGTNNDVYLFRWTKATRKASLVTYTFAGTDYTSSCTTKWYINKPGGMPQDGYINYSTSERIVGTWVDGKPLYQKTIVDTTNDTVNVTKYISIGASIDTCVSCNGVFLNTNNVFNPLPYFTNAVTNNNIAALKLVINPNDASSNKNTIGLVCSSSNLLNRPVYVTIQYTKTAD